MMALGELGIPDFSEEEWEKLNQRDKFAQYLKIRDEGKTMSSPLTEQMRGSIQDIGFGYPFNLRYRSGGMSGTYWMSWSDEFLKKDIVTYEELLAEIQSRARFSRSDEETRSLSLFTSDRPRDLELMQEWAVRGFIGREYGPYHTNNFIAHYFSKVWRDEIRKRKGQGKAFDDECVVMDRVDEIAGQNGFPMPPGEEETTFCYENFRRVYPFYIILKREGFAPIDL